MFYSYQFIFSKSMRLRCSLIVFNNLINEIWFVLREKLFVWDINQMCIRDNPKCENKWKIVSTFRFASPVGLYGPTRW